jgi:hypothetical protein
MKEALLLWTAKRVVGAIEVRDEDAMKILEQIVEEGALPRRPENVHDLLGSSKYPHIAFPTSQCYLSFIYLKKFPCEKLLEKILIARFIVMRHHWLKPCHFSWVYGKPKHIVNHNGYHRAAHPVSYILMHCPTHQSMKMFGQPFIATGYERVTALQTMMDRGDALDELSFDSS